MSVCWCKRFAESAQGEVVWRAKQITACEQLRRGRANYLYCSHTSLASASRVAADLSFYHFNLRMNTLKWRRAHWTNLGPQRQPFSSFLANIAMSEKSSSTPLVKNFFFLRRVLSEEGSRLSAMLPPLFGERGSVASGRNLISYV